MSLPSLCYRTIDTERGVGCLLSRDNTYQSSPCLSSLTFFKCVCRESLEMRLVHLYTVLHLYVHVYKNLLCFVTATTDAGSLHTCTCTCSTTQPLLLEQTGTASTSTNAPEQTGTASASTNAPDQTGTASASTCNAPEQTSTASTTTPEQTGTASTPEQTGSTNAPEQTGTASASTCNAPVQTGTASTTTPEQTGTASTTAPEQTGIGSTLYTTYTTPEHDIPINTDLGNYTCTVY